MLAVCHEVRTNGPVPVVPGICLPEQVLAAVDDEVVHFLALLSEPGTVRRRIAARTGFSDLPSPESHVELDRRLRAVTSVPAPHAWTTHDMSVGDVRGTREAGAAWAAHVRR